MKPEDKLQLKGQLADPASELHRRLGASVAAPAEGKRWTQANQSQLRVLLEELYHAARVSSHTSHNATHRLICWFSLLGPLVRDRT